MTPSLPVVWTPEHVVALMRDEAEDHRPHETGGLLLGYWANEGEAVVTTTIGPGPRAVHWSTGFRPDADYQEAELANEYRRSEGRVSYLGDWHTHPGSAPIPSKRDERTMRRIASEPEARCPRPLMLILGERERWQLAGWTGRLGILRRLKVEPASLRLFALEGEPP